MLLGIPLLPLLTVFQFSEKCLSIGFIHSDNLFQFLHEEQLQHALVGVQVSKLEEFPLQDVVILHRGSSINLKPVRNFCSVIRICRYQKGLVSFSLLWLVCHRRRLIIPRNARSTGMSVLSLLICVIYVIGSKFWGFHSLPSRRKSFSLKRMAPMSCISVMIYVIFSSSHCPVHSPARRKG